MPRDAPVFIAGPDRSGTTLLFALLASHPDFCMVRRTNVWRYFDRRYGDLAEPANLEQCLDHMVRYNRMRHLQPDPDRIRREFLGGPRTYGRLFTLFYEHNAERAERPRWGDKSLHTEHYASRVFTELPHARIVHMVRDPRDRYASTRHRNGQDLARVGATTGRWLMSARAAMRNASRYPDQYLIVRYEDLARAPEDTLRRICEHIDAPYDPRMLTMDGVPEHRDSGGNSSFGDHEPGVISTRSIGRFRDALSPTELAFIELIAGPDLTALGYARSGLPLEPRARLQFVARELPVGGARMIAWMTFTRAQRWRGTGVPAARLRPPQEAQ
jgi:Sulfotransferase family